MKLINLELFFKRLGFLMIPIFILFSCTLLYGESETESLAKIQKHKSLIISASDLFNISPIYLAAIIYTERTLNYDWTDKAFDEALAKLGKNSSIGFCQVKLKTAYFIEKQLNDSTSVFFPGKNYKKILPVSKNPYRLISKLENDSLNILYAAAYLRIIQSYWSKNKFPIDDGPGIIGSLYQLGLFDSDGMVRRPHFLPRTNDFGKTVIESIYLFNDFLTENKAVFY